MFCWNCFECKNIVDCISVMKSELCYDCCGIENCYQVQHAESCSNCSESYFLENCRSCKNCYGCVNLSNKQYCWFNEQLTKAEFEKRIVEINLENYQRRKEEKEKFASFKRKFPRKYLQGNNNENCTGNYINNCKASHNLFHSTDALEVENSLAANKCKDDFCVAYCISSELTYNVHAGIGHYNIQFCGECIQLKDSMYCLYCVQNCSDCFGCVGLKKKQYCILNKQYSKEEYEKLLQQIKQDLTSQNAWEEYFPTSMSPMYYNQSDGMIIFPLTKEEALKRGFAWKDEEPEVNQPVHIPDTITAVADSILQTTLTCEQTGKRYRIVKPELAFYRQMNIPLPHIAPLERVHNLASIFQIQEVQKNSCSKCRKEIFSVYDPIERPTLCEECYLSQV